MIEYIEIKGFESHAHTIIDDLSGGLNLICGDSNAGKTSIVRAIKLVAYNDYDPKSLRVGCSQCEVIVRTHRGTVKVTRGPKKNLWEITPKGQPTETYDKVGKAVVPRAAEILGLNIVKLGDVDVPVNIMDQLESHFMLAGIGNKDASGSTRAQVVDEISGLSGIEGVIKSVSLDNHRLGREVSVAESEIKEKEEQLHDEKMMKGEGDLLDSATKSLSSHDECWELANNGAELTASWEVVSEEAGRLKDEVAELPDLDCAKVVIKTAGAMLVDAAQAVDVHAKGVAAAGDVERIEKDLATIPDMSSIELEAVKDMIYEADSAKRLLSVHAETAGDVEGLQADVDLLSADASPAVKETQKALDRLKEAESLRLTIVRVQGSLDELGDRIKRTEDEMKKANEEKELVLSQVKLCPLTLGPVSDDCLKEAR